MACRKTILILGARANQVPAIITAKKMGLEVVCIDPLATAPGSILCDFHYVFDLADAAQCLRIARRHRINGVITVGADYPVPAMAKICKEMDLPGIREEVAESATNKRVMRRQFEKAGVPSPYSLAVHTLNEAIQAYHKLRGPAIFKPAVSHGGRGITRINERANIKDLRFAYERAIQVTRGDGILVEEFVDGPEFSVECLTVGRKTYAIAVTDKLTTGEPYYVEIGHSQPTGLSSKEQTDLIHAAILATQALGIDYAASHVEIRISKDGPKLMEVGARLGGGFINSYLVPLSTGIDMVRSAIEVALGRNPDIAPRFKKGAAVRFLTPSPGRIKSIIGLEKASKIEGVAHISIDVKPGESVPPLLDGSCRVGYVISTGPDAQTAIHLAELAKQKIIIEIEDETKNRKCG